VAIRSSYWGQGGHNAALLVGDFFKGALDGGRLDAQALFPGARQAPPRRDIEPPEESFDVPEDMASDPVDVEEPAPPLDVSPRIESIEPLESFQPVEVAPPTAPLGESPPPPPREPAPTLRREDLY